jgi:glycosyltransferase involved in cell wall biosynthesis
MNKKKNIVYLGCSGFPYGLAEIQKIILISKSLIAKGNDVTVVCKNGVHKKKQYDALQTTGEFQKIKYVYTSGSPFRHEKFLKRNFLKIKGIINEFYFLKKSRKNKELHFAILSTQNIYEVFYYSFLSKLFGFKTVLNYVEFPSGIRKKPFQISRRFNDFLFDKYAVKLTDSIFPISEFLINKIEAVSPGKKYLKIPGLTDFERYINIPKISGDKYFLFCGAAAYLEIICFIIDSFTKINDESIYLYLVINGEKDDKLKVEKYANENRKKTKIKMFSGLSEKELFTYYKNAIALLIPLRPTLQDIARFPHKTGEYLASENPVISTNYGEVKYYFKDEVNMLLAESYDTTLFAEKMQFVIANPEIARQIGVEGKKMAAKLFDYNYKAIELDNFLNSAV